MGGKPGECGIREAEKFKLFEVDDGGDNDGGDDDDRRRRRVTLLFSSFYR